MRHYPEIFYRRNIHPARSTADEIAPILVDLIAPKSVVDVGCSTGTWLAVLQELGVEDILGVDGPYVPKESLEIPQEKFHTQNIEHPFQVGRAFDLVISLEVAEHLPPASAPGFVDSLTRLAPVVLFSAAIPFQGGVGHCNEQWPGYWAKLFETRGFVSLDCLRMKVWQNPRVAWWYAQNIVLYVRLDYLGSQPRLKHELENSVSPPASLIHPTRYLATADLRAVPLRRLLRALPAAFARGVTRMFRKPSPPPWGGAA